MDSPMDVDRLDIAVQQTIASLEEGMERVRRLTGVVQAQHERSREELQRLRTESEVQEREFPGLEDRLAAAGQRVDAAAVRGLSAQTEIMDAFAELAEAKAELRVARARQTHFLHHAEYLEGILADLQPIVTEGGSLAEQLGRSIPTLKASAQEMGTQLASAQQSRALGLHVIRAQEEERRRLAREIHDGPTQLLNSVVLRIEVCQRFFETDVQRVKAELQQLKELVRLSLQDVRKIIFDLRPMTLDDLGLIPALRTFLKDYQAKTGIEADIAVFGSERRYDSAYEIALFRIVQEALTNVSKHAEASRVWVKVETGDGRDLKLYIKDDGAGFDPSRVQRTGEGTRFGLVAMRERCELLGGTMQVQSSPGNGTKLSFTFPVTD